MMPDLLALPLFEEAHRELARHTAQWARDALPSAAAEEAGEALERRAREMVARLGAVGLTRYCVPERFGGACAGLDARSICLIREILAYHDGLADFAFALQGLGSGALSLAGSDTLCARYLPRVARGEAIAAFALSEPDAGSDVAALRCRAERREGAFVLEGTKSWISNAGIADFYCLFARTQPAETRADGSLGARGISAFLIEPGDPGFSVARRIEINAPHPLGELALNACTVPAERLIGAEGEGFKIAMRTLDVFRASVAAAATGLARRALAEALGHVRRRRLFGRALAEFQLTQGALADMATEIDAAALLTYRAAWLRDAGQPVTQAAAMAKLTATESAQRVIDRAVQLLGARGVERGTVLERLYREVRSLRIYEGASEVQRLIIAREVLK